MVTNITVKRRDKFFRFTTVTAANGKRLKRNLTGIPANSTKRPTKPLASVLEREEFLKKISDPRKILGQQAACISTKTKWQDEYAQGSKLKVPKYVTVRR
jgi:hypothetical protein